MSKNACPRSAERIQARKAVLRSTASAAGARVAVTRPLPNLVGEASTGADLRASSSTSTRPGLGSISPLVSCWQATRATDRRLRAGASRVRRGDADRYRTRLMILGDGMIKMMEPSSFRIRRPAELPKPWTTVDPKHSARNVANSLTRTAEALEEGSWWSVSKRYAEIKLSDNAPSRTSSVTPESSSSPRRASARRAQRRQRHASSASRQVSSVRLPCGLIPRKPSRRRFPRRRGYLVVDEHGSMLDDVRLVVGSCTVSFFGRTRRRHSDACGGSRADQGTQREGG